jgi:hypothetical protein
MRKADVCLLGEYHDDSVAHALQLALLQHVAARLGHTASPPARTSGDSPHTQQDQQLQQKQPPSRPLILSLEMFETDVQPVLSEYLAGHIPLSELMKDARWVGWHTRNRGLGSGTGVLHAVCVVDCILRGMQVDGCQPQSQSHSFTQLRLPCPVL